MSNLDKSLPKWEVYIMALANLNPLKKINTFMLEKQDKDKYFQSLLCWTSLNKMHCLFYFMK